MTKIEFIAATAARLNATGNWWRSAKDAVTSAKELADELEKQDAAPWFTVQRSERASQKPFPETTKTPEEGPWFAGAIGHSPQDDALVWRDDATTGASFYAANPHEAKKAVIILNEFDAISAYMTKETT
jgi:hypothetical protein